MTGDPIASPSDPLFVARGLSKRYDGRMVLDAVDFEIRRGECLVVLGRSGTGKSVTLRQLNGLEKPDAGNVTFDGIDLSSLDERQLFPLRRRIAMLFQSGALFDSMDVFDNVAFPLREHTKMSEPEVAQRVEEKLRKVHLKDVAEKMPSQLSGGMRKRVALARSLSLEPEVMLFDEPTTGLDPVTSATIGSLIEEIQKDLGVTSVVVTHDLALARQVGDRLAFLSAGKFQFIGDWAEADRSSNRELADFLAGKEEEEEANDAV